MPTPSRVTPNDVREDDMGFAPSSQVLAYVPYS